jgi:hypothetical protein
MYLQKSRLQNGCVAPSQGSLSGLMPGLAELASITLVSRTVPPSVLPVDITSNILGSDDQL